VAPWVFLNPMKPAVNRIVARMAEAGPKKVVDKGPGPIFAGDDMKMGPGPNSAGTR